MVDIAQLGFAVDTAELNKGSAALEALIPSAKKVEAETDKVSKSFLGMGSVVDRITRGMGNAFDTVRDRISLNGARFRSDVDGMAASANRLTPALNAASHGAAVNATTMRELLVVTRELASGNLTRLPGSLSILIPQLSALSASGIGLTGVLKGLGVQFGILKVVTAEQAAVNGAAIASNEALAASSGAVVAGNEAIAGSAETAAVAEGVALTAFGVALIAIGVIIATVASAFAIGAHSINEDNKNIAASMGLTTKQMEELKKKGVETTVTLGDTFKAFFSVVGDRLKSLFDSAGISKTWSKMLDEIASYALMRVKSIVGLFVGAVEGIKASWKLLPAALGDAMYSAANAVIAGVEFLLNKTLQGFASFMNFVRSGLAAIGVNVSEVKYDQIKLGRLDNQYAGAGAKAGDAFAGGFVKGVKASDAAIDRFFGDVSKKAVSNARDRIRDAAGAPGKSGKGRSGKSDSEKFEDIVAGADNDIEKQNARAAAVQLSAEAAATLEEKQKLLNEANSKGITLTDGMKTKIDELSAAYGRAKVAADNAVALRDILKGADGDINNLKAQAELIGLEGRQLAYQTEMQKLLNEAKAKSLTIDAAMRAQFETKANSFADQSQANAHNSFMSDISKGAEDRMNALKDERAAIGLNEDAVTKLRIENQLLAQARQKNIDLTPADVAAIHGIAEEQGAAENAIRKTREAMDFAKDTAKGFFKDIFSGLQQGKSLWESFANAATNALNKIAEKLIDKAINVGIDALLSAFGYSGGGTFGDGSSGAQGFASGGAFTNNVVDKPTMFAYGGSNLGIMGEAGPEAIMPLKRGSDGSLGVQMHGGDRRSGSTINAPVTINNDNRVTGAVSSADIVALQRASAEQTKAQMAREIPGIIQSYQRDGAIV